MKKNDYDAAAEAVDNLGGEESLGKLHHIPGTQAELTPTEKAGLDTFIDNHKKLKLEKCDTIEGGWVPVDRKEMGVRGKLYPETWEFRIRPATVNAIKNWNTIDDTDPLQVVEVLNEFLNATVSIKDGAQKIATNNIHDWDRFWFILKAKEYTFAKGEKVVKFDAVCDSCGDPVTYELNAESLAYTQKDDWEDYYTKYWKGDKWIIDPKEFGYSAEPITLWNPKTSVVTMILNWAVKQRQDGKTPNRAFILVAPWMIEKGSANPEKVETIMNLAEKKFNMIDGELYSFIKEVIDTIKINAPQELKATCTTCGEEVTARFPLYDAICHLFSSDDKHKKFSA